MSTIYHAHMIVGLRLPFSVLINKEMVRSCEHVHPGKTGDAPFCSQCGQKMWVEKGTYRKEFNPVVETLGGIGTIISKYHDFVFVCGMYTEISHDEEGPCVKRFHYTEAREELVKERIKTAMSNLGLWDESEFGQWLVMTCS